MKKCLLILLSVLLCLELYPQNADAVPEMPATQIPVGWKFVPLPILSFNSDLGLQLGGFVDIYDYGKSPSVFPDYNHRFHIEASYYTKGQTLLDAEYDSRHLIPGVRLSASVTYSVDPLSRFYGFNGDVEQYDSSKDRRNNLACYSLGRKMFRVLTAFQGRIVGGLNWVGGVSFWNYDIYDLNFGDYDPLNTVYHKYVTTGVISGEEASGGNVLELKAGLVFDSRDFEPAPTRGIRAELYGCADPGVCGNTYLKLCAQLRGYLTPGPDWLTLAGRAAYQGVVAGSQPFYTMQHIYTLTPAQCYAEGLGGFNTVRGMLSGRLLADGYIWANFEARIRLFEWEVQKQHFEFGINPLFDLGCIVQPSRIREMAAASGRSEAELKEKATQLHKCVGLGVKFGFNRNTIMSVELAKSLNSNDGPLSVAVCMNYTF